MMGSVKQACNLRPLLIRTEFWWSPYRALCRNPILIINAPISKNPIIVTLIDPLYVISTRRSQDFEASTV